jgi:hypothetical protein
MRMLETEIALGMLDKALAAIGLAREARLRRDQQFQEALFALYTALNETKRYIAERRDGKKRDRKSEFALADLWERTAVHLRHIDPRLAHICHMKGGFWTEPELWDAERIRRSGIQIDRVFRKARRLLLKR